MNTSLFVLLATIVCFTMNAMYYSCQNDTDAISVINGRTLFGKSQSRPQEQMILEKSQEPQLKAAVLAQKIQKEAKKQMKNDQREREQWQAAQKQLKLNAERARKALLRTTERDWKRAKTAQDGSRTMRQNQSDGRKADDKGADYKGMKPISVRFASDIAKVVKE